MLIEKKNTLFCPQLVSHPTPEENSYQVSPVTTNGNQANGSYHDSMYHGIYHGIMWRKMIIFGKVQSLSPCTASQVK